jgi:hypothetical protein
MTAKPQILLNSAIVPHPCATEITPHDGVSTMKNHDYLGRMKLMTKISSNLSVTTKEVDMENRSMNTITNPLKPQNPWLQQTNPLLRITEMRINT